MRGLVFVGVCSVGLLAGCAQDHDKKAESAACTSDPLIHETEPAKPAVTAAPAPTPAAAPQAEKVAKFGGESAISDAQAVPIETVLANPAEYKDKPVRVTGTVSAVCEKKGCWLRISPKNTQANAKYSDVFIKLQDPSTGRLVPMEAIGHEVAAEGMLKVGMMSEASARHFKMDGGASKEEIEKIVGPQPQLVLVKPSIAIKGVERASAE